MPVGEVPVDRLLGHPEVTGEIVHAHPAGLCHTDLAAKDGHLPFPLPGVFGHEGSGVVTAVGESVAKVAVGDKVVLSFNSCGECRECRRGEPAYCHEFRAYNFGGARPDGRSTLHRDGTPLGSEFFGQSSFATHAIAHERNLVKVPDDAPLAVLGPLGCACKPAPGPS